MSSPLEQTVDLHSVEVCEGGWEVRCYQSAALLKVMDPNVAIVLLEAVKQERPVLLNWNPESGEIYSAG